MLYTAMDYFGYNTGKRITLCTKDNNNVNILKETKLEKNPFIVYAPQYSSNSNYISVTEVGFYSNATRVYFRVIGFNGMWLRCSKKTTMIASGKEYLITGCNAVYKPDKLVFQANGQIYDFYMDFPPINRNSVKSIKIAEPEKDGWNFTIQL